MSSESDTPVASQSSCYIHAISGVAVFDLSGLPKEYFTTVENGDITWVQTIFQALGLRSLLMSSLQVDGFHHAVIHGSRFCAVVIKQRAQYIALLVQRDNFLELSESFVQWMHEFEPGLLMSDPRFSRV